MLSNHFNVLQNSGELHGLVLALHGCWIQAISPILELDYEPFRVTHSEVILGTKVFKRLHMYA